MRERSARTRRRVKRPTDGVDADQKGSRLAGNTRLSRVRLAFAQPRPRGPLERGFGESRAKNENS